MVIDKAELSYLQAYANELQVRTIVRSQSHRLRAYSKYRDQQFATLSNLILYESIKNRFLDLVVLD
jgi:hypothetical protein